MGCFLPSIFDLLKRTSKKEDEQSTQPISMIVAGLGNPGQKYERTRHNAGFLAIDYIAGELGFTVKRLRFKSLCGEAFFGGVRALVMKPQTYMNNSGEAIREAAEFYKIPTERILIICDDINLLPGVVRIRARGSDGGHNGLKSIIYQLNSDAFPRIRIGVGTKPSSEWDLADWVTGNFTVEDGKKLFEAFPRVAEAVPLIAEGKIELAQSRYNG